MKILSISMLFHHLLVYRIDYISAKKSSFILSFQEDGGAYKQLSVEEWAEFKVEVPRLDEFTVCHWEKLNFFNPRATCPWAYCIVKSKADPTLRCTQLWYKTHSKTAGRHLRVFGGFGDDAFGEVLVKPYRHRSWNHFCWSFSRKTHLNKIYFNGNLSGTFVINTNFTRRPIYGSADVEDSSFIIGQEPDSIRGGFESEQLFQGRITELNMWDKVLSDDDIIKMAKCKKNSNGNIISWNKEKISTYKVDVEELDDVDLLCERPDKLFLFPQKRSQSEAKTICAAHGAKIFTPTSLEETQELAKMVNSKKDICMDEKTGYIAWLGAQKIQGIWYDMNEDQPIAPANYSRWIVGNGYYPDMRCAFLQSDGYWHNTGACSTVLICTVCSYTKEPVLTLGGLCYSTKVSWNFYLTNDEAGQVMYDGYKNSRLVFINGSWVMRERIDLGRDHSTLTMYAGKKGKLSVVGRNIWNYEEPICEIDDLIKQELYLSKCEFGEEFTCSSGHCIDIFRKCDHIKDCKDGSDEDFCKKVYIPKIYEKVNPPEPWSEHVYTNPIYTTVKIINIDFIDTVTMSVGLTIDLTFRWRDGRLMFANLENTEDRHNEHKFKKVSNEIVNQIWLPLPEIVHDNAILGTMKEDTNKYLWIFPESAPITTKVDKAIEELLYKGSENDLKITQRFKIEYRCKFFLQSFPFDEQKCDFIMKINIQSNNTIELVEEKEPVIYNGPRILTEFQVGKITTETAIGEDETRFVYSVELDRLYFEHITSTYFQTSLLWLLAYLTLFIDTKNFNNRFMGAVTALLVLAALLGGIKSGLPKTSYFKFIDLWFMWYIINIFFIIIFHVILDFAIRRERECVVNVIDVNSKQETTKQRSHSGATRLNSIVKVLLPTCTVLFSFLYFSVSLLSNK